MFAKISDSFVARLLLALALYSALLGAWMHTPPAPATSGTLTVSRGH